MALFITRLVLFGGPFAVLMAMTAKIGYALMDAASAMMNVWIFVTLAVAWISHGCLKLFKATRRHVDAGDAMPHDREYAKSIYVQIHCAYFGAWVMGNALSVG